MIEEKKKGSPLVGFSVNEVEKISLIISDVDDTITTNGKLHPCALEAMLEAEQKGYRIILLSGGSAGWCEVYLRQWPVYMVIAESGAVMLYKDDNGDIRYQQNPNITDEDLKKREELLGMIPQEYLSSDQYARLYDIAVDIKRTPADKISSIKEVCDRLGAAYAFSSIHMNIWFGDYSKKKGIVSFMQLCGIDEELLKSKSIYLGDALNDEEMFAFIPLSIGMASVAENKSLFKELPAYIAPEKGGEGFFYSLNLLPKRN